MSPSFSWLGGLLLVKILATLGPSSSSLEMLRKLFYAGADGFRINMSHASI
ncbi:MAG: hypothetical protein F6K09_18230, partial [Merismopedia sp. SIO2A8]|nr:hypothetical protein [Merismopedia sp. SIO2A8]